MNLCTLKTIKEEDFSNLPLTGSEVDHESEEIEDEMEEVIEEEQEQDRDEVEIKKM